MTAPYANNLQDEGRYGKVPAGGTDGRYEKFGKAVQEAMGMMEQQKLIYEIECHAYSMIACRHIVEMASSH